MDVIGSRQTNSVSQGGSLTHRLGRLATIILAGFGVTIVLWLAAGVDLMWRSEQADSEVNALTDRVLRAERALEAIRTSVLLGAIDWRDALLDGYRKTLVRRGITDRFESMSEREREVFQLIAEGHSNRSITTILGVSPATVETHRAHIMEKLDLHSVAEIVLYAVRRGAIS